MIKLNCDLGETERITDDSIELQVMPHIDMANIACGFHAGNSQVMRACIELALANNVAIGAHPSYPDRENFGRQSMDLNRADIGDLVYQQLRTIDAVADACETSLDYVKAHGALYNDMLLSDEVFYGVLQGVAQLDSRLPVMMMATVANKAYQDKAKALGIELIFEAFIDRRYSNSGRLQSRKIEGAVYHKASDMLAQLEQLLEGQVISASGKPLAIDASSLCVHGDNAESVALIQQIRQVMAAAQA